MPEIAAGGNCFSGSNVICASKNTAEHDSFPSFTCVVESGIKISFEIFFRNTLVLAQRSTEGKEKGEEKEERKSSPFSNGKSQTQEEEEIDLLMFVS